MNRKILGKYLLICLPFVVGATMYCLGTFNIVSSLLFFGGGYVAVKNLFDYRKIKRNKKMFGNSKMEESIKIERNEERLENEKEVERVMVDTSNRYRDYDSVPGLKRTRRYTRVRKRIK